VNIDDIVSYDNSPVERDVESVAKRLRSNKGKTVLSEVETAKTKSKIVGVGPKKGWSKVEVKSTAGRTRKRKVVPTNESDYDVEGDAPNIIPSTSRKSTKKKIVQTVANVPIDKVSFHLPENAQRWRFIYHRRLALERELGKEALEIEAVMELIKEAGLMKTVCNLGDFYEKLVKEFLVNISIDCDNSLIREYQRVFVRGERVNFSPSIINKFLGIEEVNFPKLEITDNQVRKEITANQLKVWPKKKKILSGKLSVKYAILNTIVVVNWVPTTHSSDVATRLGKFIYVVGSKSKMDFGAYIFEQTMRHAKTDAIRFSIVFPTLLCSIILDQHPNIKTSSDVPEKRKPPLTLHSKLFGANHIPDIVGTSGVVPAARMMRKQEIVTALKDTCVMLNERKAQFELMIHSLEKEDAAAENESEESEEEEADTVEDDNADEADNSNEDASSNEDSGSSSEEAE